MWFLAGTKLFRITPRRKPGWPLAVVSTAEPSPRRGTLPTQGSGSARVGAECDRQRIKRACAFRAQRPS